MGSSIILMLAGAVSKALAHFSPEIRRKLSISHVYNHSNKELLHNKYAIKNNGENKNTRKLIKINDNKTNTIDYLTNFSSSGFTVSNRIMFNEK
jgi:hypothetical protein